MQQAGQIAANVYKSTIVHDLLHGAFKHAADRQLADVFQPFLCCLLHQDLLRREDQLFAVSINFRDVYTNLFIQIRIGVFHVFQVQLGCRDESADAFHIKDRTGVRNAGDGALDDGVVLHHLLQLLPGQFCICLFFGEDDVAGAIICAGDDGFELIANLHIRENAEQRVSAHILNRDLARCVIIQVN